MASAVLAITYAEVPGFPAGSVVDHIVATVTGAASSSQSVAPGTSSVSFSLAAGSYTFSVQAADASGAFFGSPVTGSFTITAPATVSLSLPASVTATQGP